MQLKFLIAFLTLLLSSGVYNSLNDTPNEMNANNAKKTELGVNTIEKVQDSLQSKIITPSTVNRILTPLEGGIAKVENPISNNLSSGAEHYFNQSTIEEKIDRVVTNVEQPDVEQPTDEDDTDTAPEINQDEVNNVMELIAGIGDNITFDDNELLEGIQKEYASLNAEEKKLVTNYSKFESAQIKMDDIKKQIHNVYNLIGMIPEEITIDNLVEAENKVAQAEAAYNSLPEESKKGIPSTTYSIMVFSRDAITRLKNSIEYANDERVLAIQEKIEQLPVLTNADMSDYDTVKNADIAIKAVVDEYVNLPQELQHAVNNREKLDQAYEKVRYLKAKIIEKEIASIDLDTVTEDDKPKLIALRDAFFNDLDKIGQALVENYPHLIAAINKLATNK